MTPGEVPEDVRSDYRPLYGGVWHIAREISHKRIQEIGGERGLVEVERQFTTGNSRIYFRADTNKELVNLLLYVEMEIKLMRLNAEKQLARDTNL